MTRVAPDLHDAVVTGYALDNTGSDYSAVTLRLKDGTTVQVFAVHTGGETYDVSATISWEATNG